MGLPRFRGEAGVSPPFTSCPPCGGARQAAQSSSSLRSSDYDSVIRQQVPNAKNECVLEGAKAALTYNGDR